jgi:signal transduction histidine kinase
MRAGAVDRVNILMVDDQPAKVLSYEAMLAELGENLIKAGTAREALAHLLREDIAVVLMDVHMPEIDGFELATMIRQHPRCQRTAIIFVSAVHMSDFDKVRGYEAGAVDYVSVPVIPEILRAKMRVFIDLHRKTAELKRLNDELDARVKARTDELELSLARLRESETMFRLQSEMLAETDRRKNEFLAMLAHELRNPLAPIRNAVEVMRRNGSVSPDLNWVREMIDRQVSHLVRLVDDLVDASRITRGKMVLSKKTVDLTRLIAEAVESIGYPMHDERRGVVVTLPSTAIYVEGDAVRLTQVFLNLLSNAIKFTPAEGKVMLSVARTGDKVEVRVKDTGRGIDAADLAHIFEMFYQGEDESGERSGLGLGLTLVKSLVEMHGGSVEGRSAGGGQGSEFVVVLPLIAGAERGDNALPATAQSAQVMPRRILVVDDNRDAADSLAQLLREVGHDVAIAYDAAAAVNATSTFRPNTVLLDIGMPVVDGYAAAKTLRGQPDGTDIFLVAMTGWGQPEDKRRALEAGFDAHLVKPVSLDALLDVFSRNGRVSESNATWNPSGGSTPTTGGSSLRKVVAP